jgi:hypothetical protein
MSGTRVTLDLPDGPSVYIEHLRSCRCANAPTSHCEAARAIARQIEAQTKPPRIPEPGLWGVVSEGEPGKFEGTRYVRDDADPTFPWAVVAGFNRVAWHEIDQPVLIREGLS